MPKLRLAEIEDALLVATLLDAFNREFDTPTPGVAKLAARLTQLLDTNTTFVVLADECGLAVVTLRPNVWFDGDVALLDELYVAPTQRNQGIGSSLLTFVYDECRSRNAYYLEINVDADDVDAQRFYRRHGLTDTDPDTGLPAYYFWRDL